MRLMRTSQIILIGFTLITATGCKEEASRGDSRDARIKRAFVDVTAEAGIHHTHQKPILDRKLDNIMTWVCSVGAAAAAGDFDNDGWIDLYVTNSKKDTPNFLYRNNGDGTFTDVAKQAGVADVNGERGASMDCVWGDYNNDGFSDLYIVFWGEDALFRNDGDGTFTDVTRDVFRNRDGSPGTQWANGNAAIFWDFNLDGRLDIYVGNYFDEFDLWHLDSTRIMHDGFEKSRNGGRNFLYRQEADGTFTEIAASLGMDDPGWTLAVGSADVNNDGWPDMYSADDFGPDQFFINNRDGTFKNASLTAIGFDTKKGMNVDFGDYNNDGWLDIYVANITTAEYLQEGNMFWHNNGPGNDGTVTFSDISVETGTFDGGWGWGAKFFDYDNDGDLDLLALNGFISAGEGNYWYDLASFTVSGRDTAEALNWPAIEDRSFSGYEPSRFWRNDGFGSFTQRGREVGLDSDRDGRGLVAFDYDNDGDLDIFTANQGQKPLLLRNDTPQRGHYLTVVLEVDLALNNDTRPRATRDGIGTRVTVVTKQGQQIRERDGGNGFSGQSDPRLHFGLGNETSAKLIEIRWPDGGMQYLENVAADQIITVRQDREQYAESLVQVGPAEKRAVEDASNVPKVVVDPAEVDAILIDLETRQLSDWNNYALGSVYREKCGKYDQQDRAVTFLQKLLADHPESRAVAIQLASAFVDKIPTCGGLAAVVCKGTRARESLDVLDALIEREGGSWEAYYARGMNHLHWPRMLRHSDDAIADFERCAEMQEKSALKPYHERIYVAMGDAYAKYKQYDKARHAWRRGLVYFTNSPEMKARLAIKDDDALDDFVMKARSLEKPIDTGMSFLQDK